MLKAEKPLMAVVNKAETSLTGEFFEPSTVMTKHWTKGRALSAKTASTDGFNNTDRRANFLF
jgi:hypothetical protein